MYSFDFGKEDIVEVLDEHNMNPGATAETYLCRQVGKPGKFSCAKDMYLADRAAAIRRALAQYDEAIKTHLLDLQQRITHLGTLRDTETFLRKALEDQVQQEAQVLKDARELVQAYQKAEIEFPRPEAFARYMCTMCCKPCHMPVCPRCNSNISVSDRTVPHDAEWSRKTIDTVECKICGRTCPSDTYDYARADNRRCPGIQPPKENDE